MANRQAQHPQTRTEGRVAQRRRTRQAILAAAQRRIADGHSPSIDEIAADADVSRRTIYMHFPTLDQLLIDATSGLLSERTIEPLLDSSDLSSDPVTRVDQFTTALLEVAHDALPLARRILSLTVDAEHSSGAAPRGYRRMEWIDRILEPLRPQLDSEQFDRLAAALSVVVGWEAMIVLRDSRGLDAEAEQQVIRWAARALVVAALDEAAVVG